MALRAAMARREITAFSVRTFWRVAREAARADSSPLTLVEEAARALRRAAAVQLAPRLDRLGVVEETQAAQAALLQQPIWVAVGVVVAQTALPGMLALRVVMHLPAAAQAAALPRLQPIPQAAQAVMLATAHRAGRPLAAQAQQGRRGQTLPMRAAPRRVVVAAAQMRLEPDTRAASAAIMAAVAVAAVLRLAAMAAQVVRAVPALSASGSFSDARLSGCACCGGVF